MNVEWMCLPRFDGPSVFGAMLDREAAGFLLAPLDLEVPAGRRDVPGTNAVMHVIRADSELAAVQAPLAVQPPEPAEEGAA